MEDSTRRQALVRGTPRGTEEAGAVRTNVAVDDELLEKARRLTGIEERTALVHAGLRALIERESARRLARLGGSEPGLQPVNRRAWDEET